MHDSAVTLKKLETPELILDTERLTSNITRMEHHLASCGVPLRPHGKTAKSNEVMKRFGGIHKHGITVSTVKEAEYYFAGGFTNIIYAVGLAPDKLPRIFSLISQGAEITVILDSLAQCVPPHYRIMVISFNKSELKYIDNSGSNLPPVPVLPKSGRFSPE